MIITKLIWDHVNAAHMLEKHRVLPQEVEQACSNPHIVLRSRDGRVLVIGVTNNGRFLTAVLDPEKLDQGHWYPVTARDASRKERRLYKQQLEKEAA